MAFITPITNRTAADVVAAKSIRADWEQGTAPTTDQYITLDKGSITTETINRIENNEAWLMGALQLNGYWNNHIVTKAWVRGDDFRQNEFDRIVNNLNILRNSFYTYSNTPATPLPKLQWQNMNDIEKILYDINNILEDMIAEFRFCGTFNCGE